MKNKFIEPKLEILTFLCDEGYDSPSVGGTGGDGGDLDIEEAIVG